MCLNVYGEFQDFFRTPGGPHPEITVLLGLRGPLSQEVSQPTLSHAKTYNALTPLEDVRRAAITSLTCL